MSTNFLYDHAVLTVEQMYKVDTGCIERGIQERHLMKEAGTAVAKIAINKWPKAQFSVLCGTGNNGGDGFVAASYLKSIGADVEVFLLDRTNNLKTAANREASEWSKLSGSSTRKLSDIPKNHKTVIIDGLFGAGLKKIFQIEFLQHQH